MAPGRQPDIGSRRQLGARTRASSTGRPPRAFARLRIGDGLEAARPMVLVLSDALATPCEERAGSVRSSQAAPLVGREAEEHRWKLALIRALTIG
jgi:hypothetical protein